MMEWWNNVFNPSPINPFFQNSKFLGFLSHGGLQIGYRLMEKRKNGEVGRWGDEGKKKGDGG
ncbi:MAG: hypothetical protein HY882_15470 [Deltaproteobacteria bacterium]|nr:hypothetical protein [Deltaproteobacteria bacterium]